MMTWKPCALAGAPSPWMEIAALALALLPIAALWVMHGPAPVLFLRVSLTVAPLALRSVASRFETSQVNEASEYPSFVDVPVVSQAFHWVRTLTCLLMISGCL